MNRSQKPIERLRHIACLSSADWVQRALNEGAAGLGDTVPGGYAALVRVMHPFTRFSHEEGAPEAVSWAAFAKTFGLAMRPETQSSSLMHESGITENDMSDTASTYNEPVTGSLDEPLFRDLMAVLTPFTATPEAGVAAVWDGYGGLVSGMKAEMLVTFRDDGGDDEEVDEAVLAAALHENARYTVMSAKGGEYGVLGKAIARGPRLSLPGRDYICFEAGVSDFSDVSWRDRAPWIERQCSAESPQTPNLLWPDDRAWFMVSEIEFDSTLVACSFACAEALEQAECIEAYRIDRSSIIC